MVVGGTWDHMQLVKYLSGVHTLLTKKEMERLAVTPMFPGRAQSLDTISSSISSSNNREGIMGNVDMRTKEVQGIGQYKASELYIPAEVFWNLGFPIIEWKGRWNKNSEEGTYIISLHTICIITLMIVYIDMS